MKNIFNIKKKELKNERPHNQLLNKFKDKNSYLSLI